MKTFLKIITTPIAAAFIILTLAIAFIYWDVLYKLYKWTWK